MSKIVKPPDLILGDGVLTTVTVLSIELPPHWSIISTMYVPGETPVNVYAAVLLGIGYRVPAPRPEIILKLYGALV